MGKHVSSLILGFFLSALLSAPQPTYALDPCVAAVGGTAVAGVIAGVAQGLPSSAPSLADLPASQPPNINDPLDLLRNKDLHISMGATVREYSQEFKTPIYHPLNEPLRDGTVPWVDPKAKAVVVFVHGSGTAKASGKNFLNLMNLLSNAGVAGISFDLPFHKEGPTDPRFHEVDFFMRWLDQILTKVKSYGKPVYLVGHSYGPEVIQEYISIREYARKIKGVLLVSPSGDYHPALTWTYQNITNPGYPLFIEEQVPDNVPGGEWASGVAAHFQWMNRPTPETQVNVLLGATDEWWPGNTRLPMLLGVHQPYTFDEPFQWFKAHYPNGNFVIVPGVGHYIFEAKAENGKNLLSELLFDMVKIPANLRYVAAAARTSRQQLATLYHHNPVFVNWIGARYPHAMREEETATFYLRGWEVANRNAWKQVMTDMPTKYTDFYEQRRDSWQRMMNFLESDACRAEDRKGGWDWSNDMRGLMADFHRYLDARAQGQTIALGPDPLTPHAPPIDAEVFENPGRATRRGFIGPVGREAFEGSFRAFLAANPLRGAWGRAEPVSNHVTRVHYTLDGGAFSTLVLDGYSLEEMRQVIGEAFVDARRRAPGFGHPESPSWYGSAHGIRFRGKHKSGTVTNAEPVLDDADAPAPVGP